MSVSHWKVYNYVLIFRGPQWQSGNTLASHLWGRGSITCTALSGKAGSVLPLVSSLQYRTLTNCMYWFPLPFQLPVVIWPVQCWKRRKTPNKQTNQVGKLVVACRWSAVYSTEPYWTVCTGFLCPSNYPSWYDLYSVDLFIWCFTSLSTPVQCWKRRKPQINK